MSKQLIKGAKHVSGDFSTGRLFLTRADGSVVRCGPFVIVRGATLTDNSDSTYDLNLES